MNKINFYVSCGLLCDNMIAKGGSGEGRKPLAYKESKSFMIPLSPPLKKMVTPIF
jgi:hypothetical protein